MIIEGAAMHHCVGQYIHVAKERSSQFFSIKDKSGDRLATAEVDTDRHHLKQIFGPYNQLVKRSTYGCFIGWLDSWRDELSLMNEHKIRSTFRAIDFDRYTPD